MTPDDLKLVATNDLINELMDRHEHAVFAGVRIPKEGSTGKIFMRRRWIGNSSTCAGLCTQLQHAICEHQDANTEEDDGHDV